MNSLTFLLSDYRQRILGLLLLHPENRYHVREIARLTETVAGTLHRELSKLAEAQVLLREVSGHQVHYQANINFPIYSELASILRKTSGLANQIANALIPLLSKIDFAFIFGSMASGNANLGSDIDLLIIGSVNFEDVVAALYQVQTMLRREINPKVYSVNEWKKLSINNTGFISNILKNPKIFIVGSENDIKISSRNKPRSN